MTRLIVLVNSPYHCHVEDAEAWLRQEVRTLGTIDGVASVALCQLTSPSLEWSKQRDWIIELQCEDRDSASRAVLHEAWSMLLGDFRQLGMRPEVAIIEAASELRTAATAGAPGSQ